MSGHAPLAPSSAPEWGYCSGSVAAQAQIPEFDTEASRAGTAAHWAGATIIGNWQSDKTQSDLAAVDLVGQQDPDGTVIDSVMAEGAQHFIDDVLAVCQQHTNEAALSRLRIEQPVRMPSIHPQNYGTPDGALWLPVAKRLYVWDYKHGHGRVDAKENLQLIDYVAGLIEYYGINEDIDVVIRIIQPFSFKPAGPIDTWRVKLSELRPWFNLLHKQAAEAMTNPKLVAGAHCKYCKAIIKCPAARELCNNLAHWADLPFSLEEASLSDLAASRNMIQVAQVVAKARLEATEDEIIHRLKQGEAGGNLALQTSSKRLAWTIPDDQVIATFKQLGHSVSKEVPLTPTQAKNAVPAQLKPIVEQFSYRPVGGVTIINADEKKTAAAFSKK